MNKRFSTLLAAALVAGGLSSTVMAASVTPDKDKYYRLVAQDALATTNGDVQTAFLGLHSIKTDSLILTKAAGGDNVLSDRYFWTIKTTTTASGGTVYTLINKETQAELAFNVPTGHAKDKTTKEAPARIKGNGVLNAWNIVLDNATGSAASIYAFKGEKAYALAVNKNYFSTAQDGMLTLVESETNGSAVVTGGTASSATILKLYVAATVNKALSVTELNAQKGGKGFDLTFTPDVETNTRDNIFADKTITAMSTGTATYAFTDATTDVTTTVEGTDLAFTSTSNNEIVFLNVKETTNAAKKKVKWFAVVDTFQIAGSDSYSFAIDSMTVADDGTSLVPAPGRDLASYMFTVSNDYEAGKLSIVAAGLPTEKADTEDATWADESSVSTKASLNSIVDAATGLTTTNAYAVFVKQLGKAKELTLTETPAEATTKITFGSSTAVKDLNTKVAYFVKEMDEDNKATGNYWVAGDAKSASASAYVPSTQWNLVSNGGTSYKLVNRESGKELSGADGTAYDVDATNGVYMIGSKTVTLVKCPEAIGNYVGYKKFTASEVDNLTFAIQVQALGSDPVYLTTKDSAIVATTDADKKVVFRLKPNNEMKFGATADGDSLKRTSYMLLSADKKSYLAYDYDLRSYKMTSVGWEGNIVEGSAVKAVKTDTAYVYFRAVGENRYAIVLDKVYTSGSTPASGFAVKDAWGNTVETWSAATGVKKDFGVYDEKVSVNITNGAVEKVGFSEAANTVFMIEDGTPDYDKTIQKPAHQTITLSTDKAMALTITSDNFAAMKRVGQELKADYAADNLKMYVDTATMADVNKPLYYITTGQNVSAECLAKGERNYLVSFEDSVKVDGYTSETLPRLGFLEGIVEADTITLFNGHAIADKDTVVIKDNHANIANWAFTANENGSVSLENQATNKFVAFRNDVLVMVGSLNEAAQFTMEATEAPTANDAAPSVSEVKVIAANGAIQIVGAEGKKVVITNILGQTIANTVLTSSDATIAAPAGVVVVAVEGEEAVKAIVK